VLLCGYNSIQCSVLWAGLVKGKASLYLITERRVPELIPVLGSQPAGDVSHKLRVVGHYFLPGLHAVTPTTRKRAATSFAAW